jgi:alkylhydroperoxidase family enzyme
LIMKNSRLQNIHHLIEAVLTSPGDTLPSLRHLIEERSLALGGSPCEQASEVPPELAPYISKVALHAYKVVDGDIEALAQAGYSEDAIFEITLCAALGAGLARLERGLAALKGGKECA